MTKHVAIIKHVEIAPPPVTAGEITEAVPCTSNKLVRDLQSVRFAAGSRADSRAAEVLTQIDTVTGKDVERIVLQYIAAVPRVPRAGIEQSEPDVMAHDNVAQDTTRAAHAADHPIAVPTATNDIVADQETVDLHENPGAAAVQIDGAIADGCVQTDDVDPGSKRGTIAANMHVFQQNSISG